MTKKAIKEFEIFDKYFTTFFYLFPSFFFNCLTLLYHFSILFLPTTFTHTHTHEPHPRPTTFSYTRLKVSVDKNFTTPSPLRRPPLVIFVPVSTHVILLDILSKTKTLTFLSACKLIITNVRALMETKCITWLLCKQMKVTIRGL